MSDKKVGRFSLLPISPTEQMKRALSDNGTIDVADVRHDKGKSILVDKFREREERWRREQSMHDQQAAQAGEQPARAGEELVQAKEEVERAGEEGRVAPEEQGGKQGGDS